VPFVCSFARRTINSSTKLKISVDTTSLCLSPCRVSKYSEHSIQCCCRKTYYFRRKAELWHTNVDFISYYGVVFCLEIYEEMVNLDVVRIVFQGFGAVQKVGLSLICLTGKAQLGNADRPRWRRVTNGRIILWQRLCMQRSTGRYFDSLCNRVCLLFCTLETIPLWSSFQVVSRWSRLAGSTLLVHPPTGGHRFSAARPVFLCAYNFFRAR
jgi:hypothetical protein